jgi:hypothetical protein
MSWEYDLEIGSIDGAKGTIQGWRQFPVDIQSRFTNIHDLEQLILDTQASSCFQLATDQPVRDLVVTVFHDGSLRFCEFE